MLRPKSASGGLEVSKQLAPRQNTLLGQADTRVDALGRDGALVAVLVDLARACDRIGAPAGGGQRGTARSCQRCAAVGRSATGARQRAPVLPAVAGNRNSVDDFRGGPIGADSGGADGATAAIRQHRAILGPVFGFRDRSSGARIGELHRGNVSGRGVQGPACHRSLLCGVPVIGGDRTRDVEAAMRRPVRRSRVAHLFVK